MRAACVVLLFAIGCGSSNDPVRPANAPAEPASDDAGTFVQPPVQKSAVRTMKKVPLFGGVAVDNLLLDPNFEDGDPGIGRWYVNPAGGGASLEQVVTASSPIGMALPVGSIAGGKLVTMFAQLPGGKGPYAVSLWATTETPIADDLANVMRVTMIAAKDGSAMAGVDVAADATDTRVIDGRKWVHFRGAVSPDGYTLGALLMIRMKPAKTTFWMQAPEVVPAPLAGSALVISRVRELEPIERAEIEAAKKIPLDVGIRSLGKSKPPI